MIKTGIYLISSPNGPLYIGQTKDFEKRKREFHKVDMMQENPLIWCSYMLYGYGYHKFEMVHDLPWDVSQNVIDEYEKFYIGQYVDCGYVLANRMEGGKNGKVIDPARITAGAIVRYAQNSQN